MNFEERPEASHTGISCAACGGDAVQEHWASEKFIYGAGKDEVSLTVQVPKIYCRDCGLVMTDERAEVIRHEAVCRHLKIQTPKELILVRSQSGLNQKEFAELARVGRASLSRWESGELHQNGSSDTLIYLLSFSDNISRLRSRFEQPKSEIRRSLCPRTFRALSKEQVGNLSKKSRDFSLHLTA